MKKQTIINKDKAELLSTADKLLIRIAETEVIIKADVKKMAEEIKTIEDRHATWNEGMASLLKDLEKQLVSLMKTNSAVVFDGDERVDLKHGSLLFTIEERVKKLKDTQTMLENLKRCGFRDVIKVVENIDWDKMESWPVEKLALVGTKRTRKEIYSWETKNEGR